MTFLGPLQPLAPALVVSAYFVVMLFAYEIRSRIWGRPLDAEVTNRSASKVLGRYLRHYFMWLIRPYENALIALGISPNAITFASLLTAGASAWALATGRFALGGWLYLFTGILDIFDGRVARRTNRVSAGGAFFDSVMDRYSEIIVFGGLAYFYRDSWAFWLALAASLGSVMVSYTRARAEGLGINDVNIGTMQRPERLFTLGVVTCTAPIVEVLVGHGPLPPFAPVVVALGLLGLSANVTAVRRILHTLERLDARAAAEAIPAVVEVPAPAPAAPAPAAAPTNGHSNGKVAAVLPLRAAANR
jgi:phosphatidylglycerophosphate synthase